VIWHDLRRTFATELRGDKCMSTTFLIYWATRSKASRVHTHAAHPRRWKMQSTDSQNCEALWFNSRGRPV